MNEPSHATQTPFDRTSPLLAAALVVTGVAVAWAVVTVAGMRQTGDWPTPAAPFGLSRVLTVCLLCVIPLCLWCGRLLTLGFGTSPRLILILLGSGLALAVLGVPTAEFVREATATGSPALRHGVRLAWGAILLLPWCAAAAAVYRRRAPAIEGARPRWLFALDGLIAILFASLATVYVQQVVERQSAMFSDAVVNQQFHRARQISEQLAQLGSPTIAGQPTAGVVADLRARVEALLTQVAEPLPAAASADERLTRAGQLYSLGRFDEVALLLDAMSDDPRAELRLALSAEAQQDYATAAARYGQTIALLKPSGELDGDQLRLLRIAFERRVNNLRRIGESRRAEGELLAGLQEWPAARDALLLQLGFHYQMAGRTSEAMDFFQQAAELNPRLQPQADAARQRLAQQAEGCLLRPTRGATR